MFYCKIQNIKFTVFGRYTAFTLVELLVSISILTIIATLSLSSYPKFSEQMSVATESYKFLAYMRETQVYGVSGYTNPGEKVVYGLMIDRTNNSIKKVELKNPEFSNNSYYVVNKTDASEPSLDLGTKYQIERLCSNCGDTENFQQLYVFFKRPNPEARIIGVFSNNPSPNGSQGFPNFEVHITNKKNPLFAKKIVILQTGQMYVK